MRWRVQPFAPSASTPEKDSVLVVQEAGWVLGPVWTGGKSRPHRDSIPDPPASSQSLYRLSYPAHMTRCTALEFLYLYFIWKSNAIAVKLNKTWTHVNKSTFGLYCLLSTNCLEAFHSVHFPYSNCIFHVPIKCTYTINMSKGSRSHRKT